MSTRTNLVDTLKPLTPSSWRHIDSNRHPDKLLTPTVFYKQQEITHLTAAPMSAHEVQFLVTVVDPQTTADRGEDALDDEIETLLHAIDAARGISWTVAKRVRFNEQYPNAYDVTVHVLTKKPNKE